MSQRMPEIQKGPDPLFRGVFLHDIALAGAVFHGHMDQSIHRSAFYGFSVFLAIHRNPYFESVRV